MLAAALNINLISILLFVFWTDEGCPLLTLSGELEHRGEKEMSVLKHQLQIALYVTPSSYLPIPSNNHSSNELIPQIGLTMTACNMLLCLWLQCPKEGKIFYVYLLSNRKGYSKECVWVADWNFSVNVMPQTIVKHMYNKQGLCHGEKCCWSILFEPYIYICIFIRSILWPDIVDYS